MKTKINQDPNIINLLIHNIRISVIDNITGEESAIEYKSLPLQQRPKGEDRRVYSFNDESCKVGFHLSNGIEVYDNIKTIDFPKPSTDKDGRPRLYITTRLVAEQLSLMGRKDLLYVVGYKSNDHCEQNVYRGFVRPIYKVINEDIEIDMSSAETIDKPYMDEYADLIKAVHSLNDIHNVFSCKGISLEINPIYFDTNSFNHQTMANMNQLIKNRDNNRNISKRFGEIFQRNAVKHYSDIFMERIFPYMRDYVKIVDASMFKEFYIVGVDASMYRANEATLAEIEMGVFQWLVEALAASAKNENTKERVAPLCQVLSSEILYVLDHMNDNIIKILNKYDQVLLKARRNSIGVK